MKLLHVVNQIRDAVKTVTMIYTKIKETIEKLDVSAISEERQNLLNSFKAYIQDKKDKKQAVNLNFICTHNSRRSHLSQVWAQALADYYKVPNVTCYSGGTEATAMYPSAANALEASGFVITALS